MSRFKRILEETRRAIEGNLSPAVVDGMPVDCGGLETCEQCELRKSKRMHSVDCDVAFLKWLLEQEEKEDDAHVMFECNGKRCETCTPGCVYTTDVEFAKNFFATGSGAYIEEGAIQLPDEETEFPAFIKKEFHIPKEEDDD